MSKAVPSFPPFSKRFDQDSKKGMILAARHLVVSLLQFVVVIIIVIGEPVCRRHQAQNMCEIVESCR
jgi:hypothetical protein